MRNERILIRRILKQWKGTIEHHKLKDRVCIQIILNRWKSLVEEKQERRSKLILATDHYEDRTRQRAMSVWLKVANERKGRLRTPPDSSAAKMKFMSENVWGIKGCNVGYHRSQPIDMQRPWNSMPRPFNRNRGFVGTSCSGNDSMMQSSIHGSPLDDSMLRTKFCTNMSTESLFAPNSRHDRRRTSFLDSKRRFISPMRRETTMVSSILGASDGASSHFRRRSMMGSTESLGKDVPSWILRDLSERRSNEIYSKHRRMSYVPQESIVDFLPEAEPKFHFRNSSHFKNASDRPTAASAKSYMADMTEMKPSPRSYICQRSYGFKDSKRHQQYKRDK